MVIGIGLSPNPPRQQAPVHIRPDRPAYRIIEEKGFFGPNDNLYKMGEMIYWTGEPSLGMEPINELAVAAMKKYLAKLDDCGRKMADKLGKSYNSLEEAFDNMFENSREAEEQDGLISSISARAPTPLLGQPKKHSASISPVVESTVAPMMGVPRVPMGGNVSGRYDNERGQMHSNLDANKFI